MGYILNKHWTKLPGQQFLNDTGPVDPSSVVKTFSVTTPSLFDAVKQIMNALGPPSMLQ